MFNVRKPTCVLMLASLTVNTFAASLIKPIFDITPFTNTATVSSKGQAAVKYTVTNNTTISIPSITITPGWSSTGIGLSVSGNQCEGQTLSVGQSCTFNITIPGNNQQTSFTVRPKVCGFHQQICSQAANIVSVTTAQHALPLRLYEVIFASGGSAEELVGINTSNTADIIWADIANPSADGPLAVAPDGSKVYMTHRNADSTYSLLVFAATATSLTQSGVSYSLSYSGNDLSNPGQIAITPDGNTLYITDAGFAGAGYPVYRVDLSNSNASTAVTGISDATVDDVAVNPKGIVASPDNATIYFSNSSSSPNNIFSFANSAATTSVSNIARTTDMTTIAALLISSDGGYLYAAGQSDATNFPAAIEKYDIADNFSLEGTALPTSSNNGIIVSFALSPDNATIYTIANNYSASTSFIHTVNTSTMTASSGTAYPYNIIFGISNFNYIAYSPDGSTVAILNYGSSGNMTALFNPNTPDSVTTVNPAGSLTKYSHTWGSFIG